MGVMQLVVRVHFSTADSCYVYTKLYHINLLRNCQRLSKCCVVRQIYEESKKLCLKVT